jgi:hypothetical protein
VWGLPMKDFRFVLIAMLVLLLFVGCSKRKDVEFEVPSASITMLSDGPLTIGDPMDIALTIISRRNSTPVFPEDKAYFLPFTLRDYTVKRTRVGKGIYKTLVIYRVTIYKTGKFTLKPLSIGIGDSVLKTQPLNVHILSVLPKNVNEPKLKDIIPPYRPRVRPIFIIIATLSIVLILVIFYFAYRFLKRLFLKKSFDERPTVVEGIDPYRYSIEELEKVQQQFVEKAMNVKQVYTELSGILRYFMGRLFSIDAPQMTTGELRRALRKKLLHNLPSRRFVSLLGRSDLVKFAKENPERETVEQDIEESIEIVRDVNTSVRGQEGGSE